MINEKFQFIYDEARRSGLANGHTVIPTPMVVTGGGFREYIADGVCGFAWIVIKPATAKFAKWLKANNLASKNYGGGLQIWISDYDQSMQRKEAHAAAMADSLQKAFPEMTIYSQSRMD